MKLRLGAIALVCSALLCAQDPKNNDTAPRYCTTSGSVVLSGTTTTLTLQQTANSTKSLILESALVTTSVAGSFTQSVNGTAATTTAGTITQNPTNAPTITSQAASFTASNVGAGTQVGGIISTFAGGPGVTVDLTNNGYNLVLKKTGTASNYSITIGSLTGTANITICWREQ